MRNADAGKNLRDVRLDALFGAPASAYQEASCAPDRRAEGRRDEALEAGGVSLVVLAAAVAVGALLPAGRRVLERAGIATASVQAAAARPRAGRARPAAAGDRRRGREATINDSVSAIGDGRAARSVTVTPYVAGRVAAIDAASGDFVAAGAPLVRLDSEAEEIALDRARLTLDDARATLARDEELVRRSESQVQLREAQLAVRQAELALRDAELALERRVVRAPFDGWVGILGVDVGDQVDTAPRSPRSTTARTSSSTSACRSASSARSRSARRSRRGRSPGRGSRSTARWSRSTAGSAPTPARSGCARASTTPTTRCAPAWPSRSPCGSPARPSPAVDPLAIQWSADGAYVWTGRRRQGDAGAGADRPAQQRRGAGRRRRWRPGTLVVTEGVQMLRAGRRLPLRGPPRRRPPTRPGPAAPAPRART